MARGIKVAVVCVVVAAIAFAFGGPIVRAVGTFLGGKGPATAAAPPPTATVERADVETKVDVAGDVLPAVQVEVKAEVGARIEKIHVEEGDEVKAGDPLIDLDNTELLTEKAAAETEIAIAELELDKARRNFEREEKLMKQNLITDQQYRDQLTTRDIAERNLLKARQKLATIETKLVKTRIVAPRAGRVLGVPVVEGQVAIAAASVSSGTLLMTIADLATLEIVSHVNQIDIAKLSVGMPFTFKVDSLGDARMNGKIATIAPMATVLNSIKGFSVHLAIENPDPRLRPGMTADATIPTGSARGVLTVPVTAVFAGDSGKIAYLANVGGEADERTIKVGLSNLDRVEITEGLAEGDKVLLVRPPEAGKKAGS